MEPRTHTLSLDLSHQHLVPPLGISRDVMERRSKIQTPKFENSIGALDTTEKG